MIAYICYSSQLNEWEVSLLCFSLQLNVLLTDTMDYRTYIEYDTEQNNYTVELKGEGNDKRRVVKENPSSKPNMYWRPIGTYPRIKCQGICKMLPTLVTVAKARCESSSSSASHKQQGFRKILPEIQLWW